MLPWPKVARATMTRVLLTCATLTRTTLACDTPKRAPLARAPLGGGQILPPLPNIRDNLRTTQDIATKLLVPYRTSI